MTYGETITWLARLSLLAATEVASLTGYSEAEVRRALMLLHRAGWLYYHEPTAAQRGDGPLVAVSPAGLEQLRRAPGASPLALGALPSWQLQPRTVPAAIVAEPVTRLVNAAVAATADAVRRDDFATLSFATHRPTAPQAATLPGDARPLLRWDHVEVRIVADGREARWTFFCDRTSLPTARRKQLLDTWRALGSEGSPERHAPLLVLCPSNYERSRWLELCDGSIEPAIPIAFGLQVDVCGGYGIGDRIWQVPGRSEPRSLSELLRWVERPAAASDAANGGVAEPPEPPTIAAPASALQVLRHTNAASSPMEIAAASVLSLSPAQLRIAHLLGTQWWLSATDVARFTGDTATTAERDLSALQVADLAVAAGSPDGEARWLLTDAGLRLAAAHAGDARGWQRYRTAIDAPRVSRDGRPPAPDEHESGVARALGLVATRARDAGWTIVDWRTEHWWQGEISTRRPVPDAAFVLRDAMGARIVGLIEYERLRGGHQARDKVQGWVEWLRAERWRDLSGGPLGTLAGQAPVVLILFDGTSVRRKSIEQAMDRADVGLPLYAVSEEEFATGGFASPIWLLAGGGMGAPVPGEHTPGEAS